MATNIDWSRVKKSPIPKGDEGSLIGWYRGSGIKIAVYADDFWILDAEDNDKFLATKKGDFTGLNTGEVKELAAKLLDERLIVPAKEVVNTKPSSGMKGRVRLAGTGIRHRSRSWRKAAA